MKLHEFKAKWISKLGTYEAKSDREAQLIDLIVNGKLAYLNSYKVSALAHDLYLITKNENVSLEFIHMCKEMLRDIREIEFKGETEDQEKTEDQV